MSVDNWWLDPEQLRLFEERLAAIRLDRRDMLRYAAAAGGVSLAAVAAACGPAAPSAPAQPTEAPKPAAAPPPTSAPAAAAAKPTEAPKPAAAAGSVAAAPGVFRYPAGAGRDALSHDFNFDLYCQGDSSLFAGLGKFDPDLKAVPDMAERWESNADGSIWTFYVRKGAKWTNGDPVTAHDFEWSFKRQLDPNTKAPYAGFLYDLKNAEEFNKGKPDVTRDSVGIKATDDYTLVATMEGPRGFFPILAAYTAALPAHRASVEKYGDKWTDPAVVGGPVVSTGPFVLTKWEHNKSVEIQRNEKYATSSKPYLTKITYPII